MSDTQLVDGLDPEYKKRFLTTIISLSIQWVKQGVMVHQVDVKLVTEPWVNVRYAAFMDALRDARALIAQKPLSIETVDSKVLMLAMNDFVCLTS